MIELQIVRPDGAIEDRLPIGERQPASEIRDALASFRSVYEHSGFFAVLVLDEKRDVVGKFDDPLADNDRWSRKA